MFETGPIVDYIAISGGGNGIANYSPQCAGLLRWPGAGYL